MKNILFFILLAAVLTVPVFAQEATESNIGVNFNIGNLGLAGNLPFKQNYDMESSFSLIYIGLEDRTTNFGVGFSPLVITGFMLNEDYETNLGGASILNLHTYWNVFTHDFAGVSVFYLGPFSSINYFFVDQEFHLDKYLFTAGLHMGFKAGFGGFNYNIASFEVGYRNMNGASRYHIGGKIDLVAVFLVFILSSF